MKLLDLTQIPIVGSPAPLFTVNSRKNPRFIFDTVAGAYNVLVFAGRVAEHDTATFLNALKQQCGKLLNDTDVRLFTVTHPEDITRTEVRDYIPGFRGFYDDSQLSLHALYAANQHRVAYILDKRLVITDIIELNSNGIDSAQRLLHTLQHRLVHDAHNLLTQHVPILNIPNVFEPQLCEQLINYYHQNDATESGVTRENLEGKTYTQLAYDFKRRQDVSITDESLKQACISRIYHRVVPQLYHAFQFHADRIERHIVARYASQDQAFFKAHRDNTTLGTAHRRFAVTINLNAQDHTGGDICFPEYSRQFFHTPTGSATVFSCSMLHEVNTVTQGTRFAYLPFLYNSEDAKKRADNLHAFEGFKQID